MPHLPRSLPPRNLLRIKGAISARSRNCLIATWTGLPLQPSSPVQLAFLPGLAVSGGKLLSGGDVGTPVYAAAFLRQRRIILEASLLSDAALLRFIFVHELFHFVWMRLGNSARAEYSRLIAREFMSRARGELGESSAVKRAALGNATQGLLQSAAWREYVCESFCDSAGFLFTGASVHDDPKLGKTWTAIRRRWFDEKLAGERRWPI